MYKSDSRFDGLDHRERFLTGRAFRLLMTNSRDSINDVWGDRAPYYENWSERVDERTDGSAESWIQSACVLCSNGCGLEIGVRDGRIVGVRGRADDHVNRGRLGPKGLHGWEANNSEDRLTTPLIRKDGKLERATWDEAMNLIVEKSKTIISKHSPSAIGFYTSGQLFLEEYYTLELLGKQAWAPSHGWQHAALYRDCRTGFERNFWH